MKLIERYPVWSPADIMLRDIDDRIRSILPKDGSQWARSMSRWTPATDIHEDGDRFIMRTDLPGLRADDIEITIENNTLFIKGERKFDSNDESVHVRRTERFEGSFERSFDLPEGADSDQISASSKDGVLEIVIQKRPSILPKRIAIQS